MKARHLLIVGASIGVVIGLLLPVLAPFIFAPLYSPLYQNFTVNLYVYRNGELAAYKKGDLMTVQLGWLFAQMLRDGGNGTQESGVTPMSTSGTSLVSVEYVERGSTEYIDIWYTSTDSAPSITDYALPGTATRLSGIGGGDIQVILWTSGLNIKINVTTTYQFSSADTIGTLYFTVSFKDSASTSKTILVAKDDINPNINVNAGDTVKVTYVFTLQN